MLLFFGNVEILSMEKFKLNCQNKVSVCVCTNICNLLTFFLLVTVTTIQKICNVENPLIELLIWHQSSMQTVMPSFTRLAA